MGTCTDWRWFTSLLVLAASSNVSASGPSRLSADADLSGSCLEAKSRYLHYPDISDSILPQASFVEDLDMCSFENHSLLQRPSCCTKDSESSFLTQAWKDYNESIHHETQFMKELFMTTASKFKGNYAAVIDAAQRRMEHAFSSRQDGLLTTKQQQLVRAFFDNIQPGKGSSNVNISPSNTLLKELLEHSMSLAFQQHYISSGSNLPAEFDAKFSLCLRHVQLFQENTTFMGMSTLQQENLATRLDTGKKAMQGVQFALDLGVEVIDTVAAHVPLTAGCARDLVKLKYCGICYGLWSAQPCLEFCSDVFSVCMHEVRKFEQYWDRHLEALRVVTEMALHQQQPGGDVPSLLNTVYDEVQRHLSTTMTASSGGAAGQLYEQVILRCGKPLVKARSTNDLVNVTGISNPVGPTFPELTSLLKRLLMLLDVEVRGFFGRLPLTMCATEKFYDPSSGKNCWDGLINEKNGSGSERLQFQEELSPRQHNADILNALQQKLTLFRKDMRELYLQHVLQLAQDLEEEREQPEGSGSGQEPEDHRHTMVTTSTGVPTAATVFCDSRQEQKIPNRGVHTEAHLILLPLIMVLSWTSSMASSKGITTFA